MTKLQQIRDALAAGDERAALRIAAKFPDLGDEREAITRAWEAVQNPRFYQSIGYDPVELESAGVAAIRRRWGI